MNFYNILRRLVELSNLVEDDFKLWKTTSRDQKGKG